MCGLITRHLEREEKLVINESLDAIFHNVVWNFCYLTVLLGLSAFGIHRYFIIYLFLKNRRKQIEPAKRFRKLPFVTVQLPVFNEYYVIRRLIRAEGVLNIQETDCRYRFSMIRPTKRGRSPNMR